MTSWPALLPLLVPALVLLVVPGALVLRRCGASWSASVLGGAPLSVPVVGVAATLAQLAHLAWTLPVGLLAVAIVTAVALGLAHRVSSFLLRRAGVPGPLTHLRADRPDAPAHAGASSRPAGAQLEAPVVRHPWVVVAGTLTVTLVSMVTVFAGAIPSPESIPQMPDALFHLGVTTWLQRHDSASLLQVGEFAHVSSLSYPGGLYPFTASIAGWFDVPAAAACHAVLIVIAGVVWPAGMILLARTFLGGGRVVVAAAGVASLCLTAFPFRALDFGVVWPNLFGMALAPAVLTVALTFVLPCSLLPGRVVHRLATVPLLVIGCLGLVLAQPNALFAVVLYCCLALAVPALLGTGRPHPHREVRAARIWLALGVAFGLLALLARPASMATLGSQLATKGVGAALLEAANPLPRNAAASTVLALLVLAGAVVVARTRQRWWVLASLVASVTLVVGLLATSWTSVRWVTWPWWNDTLRLDALVVLPEVLCLAALAQAVSTWLRRATTRAARVIGIAVGAVAVLVGLTIVVPTQRQMIRESYAPDRAASWWVTPAELAALGDLAAHTPSDAVIAGDPWMGDAHLYLVADRQLLFPTEKSPDLPDRTLIGEGLDQVTTRADVCAAVQRQHVGYVITGGDPMEWSLPTDLKVYAGIDRIGTGFAAGFDVVAKSGPYTLWRVPTCTVG